MVSVVVTAVEPFPAAWTLKVVHALALLAVADHGLLVLVAFSAVPAPVRQTFFARHWNDVYNVCKPNKQEVLTWVKENRSQGFSTRESVEKREWAAAENLRKRRTLLMKRTPTARLLSFTSVY